jgi:hypothetical protein
MKNVIICLLILAFGFFAGWFFTKKNYENKVQTVFVKDDFGLSKVVDSFRMVQMLRGEEAKILRGIIVSQEKDFNSLNAKIIMLADAMKQYSFEQKDTVRYATHIATKLPDTIFKTLTNQMPFKPFSFELKDTSIQLTAQISQDSFVLSQVTIPNTLKITDETTLIGKDKELRVTTIMNSSKLLNQRPAVVINQYWTEAGVKNQRKKAWWRGAGIASAATILGYLIFK